MQIISGLHPAWGTVNVIDVEVVGDDVPLAGSAATWFAIGVLLEDVVLNHTIPPAKHLHTITHSGVALVLIEIIALNRESRRIHQAHVTAVGVYASDSTDVAL